MVTLHESLDRSKDRILEASFYLDARTIHELKESKGVAYFDLEYWILISPMKDLKIGDNVLKFKVKYP